MNNIALRIMLILSIMGVNRATGAPSEDTFVVDHHKEIVFGQSGSLSGHFKIYGNFISHAIDACFKQINSKGGVQGKKLRLISLDDHGDPELTKKNIELLYHKYKITLFIGVMGTRGMLSVLPLIKEKKIAVFFPWGSDPTLRDPSLGNIINGPGLLEPQIKYLATHILTTLRLNKIAIFHADDDFSRDGSTLLSNVLKQQQSPAVASEQYNRFTMDIATPVSKLIPYDPKVVICLSTSMPAIKVIDQFFQMGHFGTRFFGIDSTFLAKDIAASKGIGFYFTAPVPNPATSELALAKEYRAALTHYFPDDGYSTLAFSYYAGAAIVIKALQSITTITPATIIGEIESMKNTTVQGLPINFDTSNRHIFGNKIWLI